MDLGGNEAIVLVLSILIVIWGTFWFLFVSELEGGETRDERLWRLYIRKYVKGDGENPAWTHRLDLASALCGRFKEVGQLCKELNK